MAVPPADTLSRPKEIGSGPAAQTMMRVAVIVIALAIIYLRMPTTFTNPQFWGEDIIFFDESRHRGWASLLVAVAGWLAGVQFLVANLATYVSPIFAPAIFNYTAVALTLLVVWMATSPRLDLPYKPLLAIAIVVVPMAYEELGTLTNSQWILPIGAITLMFMRPERSALVLAAETMFVAVTALSGPFTIFLAPMFLLRLIKSERPDERRRFMIFLFTTSLGAVAQVLSLVFNPAILTSVRPVPFPWTDWVNLPFTQWMTTFGPLSQGFQGTGGVVTGCMLLVAATVVASQRPYRTQKLFMLFFAVMIVASGLYKFRVALATQYASQRYFYFGSVFALWFICCLSRRKFLGSALAAGVAMIELMLLPVVANTPRITRDLEWPVWASYLSSGLPTLIPSSPDRFYVASPATATGPLARFAPWIGRDFSELPIRLDPSACSGTAEPVEPLPQFFVQQSPTPKQPEVSWIGRGSAWDTARNRPVQLVALVNDAGRVLGFGFPGFTPGAQAAIQQPGSGWVAMFAADPGQTVRAYGIVDDGQWLCPLANARYFPLDVQPLASKQFIAGVEILPGKDVVQRFKPTQRLEAMTLPVVTWGKKPSAYSVEWTVTARVGGRYIQLGEGKIDAAGATDWLEVQLPLTIALDEVPDEVELTVRTDAAVAPVPPLGLPLYRRAATSSASPAMIDGKPSISSGLVGLKLFYAGQRPS
jgi:hypothetical protein